MSNNYYNNNNNNNNSKATVTTTQPLFNNSQQKTTLINQQPTIGQNVGAGGVNNFAKHINTVTGIGTTMQQQFSANTKNNHTQLLSQQQQQHLSANTLQQTPQQQRHQQTLPPPPRQSHTYPYNNNNNNSNNLNLNIANVAPNMSGSNITKQQQQSYTAITATPQHINGALASTPGATQKSLTQPLHNKQHPQQQPTAIANNTSKIASSTMSATNMFFVRPTNPPAPQPLHIGELQPFVPVQLF